MDTREDQLYDTIVYDGARDLAALFGKDIKGLLTALVYLTNGFGSLDAVIEAHRSQCELVNYRGKMCDEGLIEVLKECMRPIFYAKCKEAS